MRTRFPFYLLAFFVGCVYFSIFILAHLYLVFTGWVPIFDWMFFIFNIAIVIVFLIKDTLDERSMGKGSSPVGPSWFEHAPFVIVVAFQSVISIYYDTDPLISYIKLGIFILALLDFVWDLSQDERSGRMR